MAITQGRWGCVRVSGPGGVTIPSEVEFTLVLTVVLGLCVGAVVADVLFGPDQPATSSSGSNGDQWDPWRTWWRRGREGLHAFGRWLRRSGKGGWASVARAFPDRRHAGARNPEVVPPPVAPPMRPGRTPAPRPVMFEAPPSDEVLRGTIGPVSATTPLPGAPVEPRPGPSYDPDPAFGPSYDPGFDPDPAYEPASMYAPVPSGNGDARHLPTGVDDGLLARPAGSGNGGGAAGTMTALRQRLAAPVAPPVAITIPRQVRVRAGVGLLIFTMVVGLGSAMAVLGAILVAVKVLGGV